MAVLNTFSNPDPRAIDIAHALHQSGDTLLTVLFDFRARGDYAEDRSDVEILLVQEHSPSEDQQERVKLLARPWQCLVPGPVDSSAGAMDDPGGIRTGPAQRQSCSFRISGCQLPLQMQQRIKRDTLSDFSHQVKVKVEVVIGIQHARQDFSGDE